METYWKFLLIGIGVLILGIIGLVLGISKTIIKNKTARDAALWIGIIASVIGGILIVVGIVIYARRKSPKKMYPMYPPSGYGMQPPPDYYVPPPPGYIQPPPDYYAQGPPPPPPGYGPPPPPPGYGPPGYYQ
jgi:hypothetical protein